MNTIFKDLKEKGKIVSPRGLKVLEIENYGYEFKPYERFMNYPSRKLNLDYIKKEFLWYLRGNKFDLSIVSEARMWKDLINSDGSINSNYGQYIWGDQNQFAYVIETLKNDRDSRRANMVILSRDHLVMKTKDYPCTLGLNFRIRDNKLNMTVVMRSNDVIYGLGNDLPIFSFIHEMVLERLRMHYINLEMGSYYHFAESFHIYERHFEMLDKIIEEEIEPIECPRIYTAFEVMFLLKDIHRIKSIDNIPSMFEFSKWLMS